MLRIGNTKIVSSLFTHNIGQKFVQRPTTVNVFTNDLKCIRQIEGDTLIKTKNNAPKKFVKFDKNTQPIRPIFDSVIAKTSNLEEESLPYIFDLVEDKPLYSYVTKDRVNVTETGFFIPEITMNNIKISDNFKETLRVLHKRNPNEITNDFVAGFINSVLNDSKLATAEDKIKYLKNLKILFSKKALNGEYILRGNDAKFLADFSRRNLSKENVKNIHDLIHCIEKGYLPSDVFKHIRQENRSWLQQSNYAKINPHMLKDIEKLNFAEQKGINPIDVFIPQSKGSYIDMLSELGKLEIGEMISCKGFPDKVFLKISKNDWREINIDRDTLFKIYPPVGRYYAAQGRSGTCYLLSSFLAQMNNPAQHARFLRLIEKQGDRVIIRMPCGSSGKENVFAGKFPDFDKHGTVMTELHNNKFIAPDEAQSVSSNPVIRAFEHLYGKHRKYDRANEYLQQVKKNGGNYDLAYREALQNMDDFVYVRGKNGDLYRTTLKEINTDIQNKARETYKKTGKIPDYKIFSSLEDYYKQSGGNYEVFQFMNDERYTHILQLPSYCNNDAKTLGTFRKLLADENTTKMISTKHINLEGKPRSANYLSLDDSLYGSHAYSVIGYDKNTDIVQYVNPWNSTFVFEMPLKELAHNVDFVTTCLTV